MQGRRWGQLIHKIKAQTAVIFCSQGLQKRQSSQSPKGSKFLLHKVNPNRYDRTFINFTYSITVHVSMSTHGLHFNCFHNVCSNLSKIYQLSFTQVDIIQIGPKLWPLTLWQILLTEWIPKESKFFIVDYYSQMSKTYAKHIKKFVCWFEEKVHGCHFCIIWPAELRTYKNQYS